MKLALLQFHETEENTAIIYTESNHPFYNQYPKRPISQHLSINVYLYKGKIQPLHQQALQQSLLSAKSAWLLLHSSRSWAPFPSQWQIKGDQPEGFVKCSGICLHLCQPMSCWSSSVPPRGILGSPAWPWPTGTDTAVEHFWNWQFLCSTVCQADHSQKSWRLRISLSAAGTSHFQTLPPLKKQQGHTQDKIFSLSCGCQDLKHLSCSLHMFLYSACCLDLTGAHSSLSAPSIITNPMQKAFQIPAPTQNSMWPWLGHCTSVVHPRFHFNRSLKIWNTISWNG